MIIGYDSCYCYICKDYTGHKLVKSDGFVVKLCVHCENRPYTQPEPPHAVSPVR